MKSEFTKVQYNVIEPLFQQYKKTLGGVCDEFWEDHILRADFYMITIDGHSAGYFAIYQKTKLTQFFLLNQYGHLAQPFFQQILAGYSMKSAFVATCDELFLSLCLDFHRSIELQAYFFDGSVPNEVRPPEFARSCIVPVSAEELSEVKEITGDFFDDVAEDDLLCKRTMLYRLCENGETLGFGIVVPGKLLPQYASLGMITLEQYRRRGVGRSIQLHLADLCRENGLIPISGCWYRNENSKKTIESAGRYSKTRFLNVLF